MCETLVQRKTWIGDVLESHSSLSILLFLNIPQPLKIIPFLIDANAEIKNIFIKFIKF